MPAELVDSELRAAWVAQREAMVLGDVRSLGALLDDTFHLTHMTGYVQSKSEWLDDIETGQMSYHHIDDVDVVAVADGDGDGDQAELTVRTRTEATIWGSRGNWRLRLRLSYERHGGVWIATRSIASVW